jgi:hypothetical protein
MVTEQCKLRYTIKNMRNNLPQSCSYTPNSKIIALHVSFPVAFWEAEPGCTRWVCSTGRGGRCGLRGRVRRHPFGTNTDHLDVHRGARRLVHRHSARVISCSASDRAEEAAVCAVSRGCDTRGERIADIHAHLKTSC